MKHVLHYGPQRASLLIASAGIAGGVSLAIVVRPLARRLGYASVAQIGLALSVVAYALLGFAHDLVMWFTGAFVHRAVDVSAPLRKRLRGQARRHVWLQRRNERRRADGGAGARWLDDRPRSQHGRHHTGPAASGALVIGIVRHREDATLASGIARKRTKEPGLRSRLHTQRQLSADNKSA
jgi:hypothetical protein